MNNPIIIKGSVRPEPKPRIIRPTNLLILKNYIKLGIIFIFINILLLSLIWFIDFMQNSNYDPNESSINLPLVISTFSPIYIFIWLIIAILVLILIPIYVKSMIFSVHGSELVVKKGLLNKTVKHVPYRAVTNLDIVTGPIDRLLGIGNIKIQTAGKSGASSSSNKAEENIEGIKMYKEVREYIVHYLNVIIEPKISKKATKESKSKNYNIKSEIISEVREIKEFLNLKDKIINKNNKESDKID